MVSKTIYIVENYSSSGETSGILRYNNYLFKSLKSSGLDFKFVTANVKPEILEDKEVVILSRKPVSNIKFWIKLFFFAWKIREKNPILHLHHPYMIIPFLFAGKHKNAIITIHNDQSYIFRLRHHQLAAFFYHLLWKISIRFYKIIIVDNQKLAEKIKLFINTKRQEIISLPVPVDLEQFYPKDKKKLRQDKGIDSIQKIILFAGRFVLQKNPVLAIKVFQEVKKKYSNCMMLMLGSGSLEDEMKKYIRVNRLEDIAIIGNVPSQEMIDYYNLADVLLVTSVEEGGPLVVKEAIACNLPVVSTDVGDVKEVLDEMEGSYISTGETDDLSQRILAVFLDNSIKDFSKAKKKYRFEVFSEKINNIYLKFLIKKDF